MKDLSDLVRCFVFLVGSLLVINSQSAACAKDKAEEIFEAFGQPAYARSHAGIANASDYSSSTQSRIESNTSSFSGESGTQIYGSFKLVSTDDDLAKLVLSPDPDKKEGRCFEVAPGAVVTLNGVSCHPSDLKSEDLLEVGTDQKGLITYIKAFRPVQGIIVGTSNNGLVLTKDYVKKDTLNLADSCEIVISSKNSSVSDLKVGDEVLAISGPDGKICRLDVKRHNFFGQFVENFCKNLFKPLLLFFYLGFIISVFKIHFDFPHSVYQGLTIYLLIAIGWHGGEELAVLSGATLNQALGFMLVGFLTNMVIGLLAYWLIRIFIPKMRRVDASVIAAYYGSDSAGTFVTCLGVLTAAHIAFAAYMPVMLAIMEIPGCLVGLYLVSRLRARRMDEEGNMPDEPGYVAKEVSEDDKQHSSMNLKALHEVFLNPGFFLLFGSIVIGFLSRMQGYRVVEANDKFFVSLFQGILCLFLLEMGMTAAKRLGDLKTASWKFIAFGIIAPNIFATVAILIACAFSHLTGQPFQLGTYVLFAVLCAAASYIAVPAIQRIAVPEASPTLPLAASLGLTFSYNVTIGIPLYMVIAECVVRTFPM